MATNMANLFGNQPAATGSPFNASQLDVSSRLDALATFLVSLAYNVRETQLNVGKIVQNTK